MRRFALALPLLLLTGCAAAAAPAAQEAAVPSSAQAAPAAAEPTEVAAVSDADAYWSSDRLDALDRAKDKYPNWKNVAAKVADSGTAAKPVTDSVADSAPAADSAPVAAPIAQPAPLEPRPVPTPPVASGKIPDEEFYLFLRGLLTAVDVDAITVKGLRVSLGELEKLDLTGRQRKVLNRLIEEVDKVLAKGERAPDPNWDFDDLRLPREIDELIPVKDGDLASKQ